MLLRRPSTAKAPRDAVWLDLLEPTAEERAEVEAATKLRLPTQSAIEEIESSSRVYAESAALYLSTPVLSGDDCLVDAPTTVGFVLTRERLVTLRFTRVAAFDTVLEHYDETAEPSAGDA